MDLWPPAAIGQKLKKWDVNRTHGIERSERGLGWVTWDRDRNELDEMWRNNETFDEWHEMSDMRWVTWERDRNELDEMWHNNETCDDRRVMSD